MVEILNTKYGLYIISDQGSNPNDYEIQLTYYYNEGNLVKRICTSLKRDQNKSLLIRGQIRPNATDGQRYNINIASLSMYRKSEYIISKIPLYVITIPKIYRTGIITDN